MNNKIITALVFSLSLICFVSANISFDNVSFLNRSGISFLSKHLSADDKTDNYNLGDDLNRAYNSGKRIFVLFKTFSHPHSPSFADMYGFDSDYYVTFFSGAKRIPKGNDKKFKIIISEDKKFEFDLGRAVEVPKGSFNWPTSDSYGEAFGKESKYIMGHLYDFVDKEYSYYDKKSDSLIVILEMDKTIRKDIRGIAYYKNYRKEQEDSLWNKIKNFFSNLIP